MYHFLPLTVQVGKAHRPKQARRPAMLRAIRCFRVKGGKDRSFYASVKTPLSTFFSVSNRICYRQKQENVLS
jgi:hypothetical protein